MADYAGINESAVISGVAAQVDTVTLTGSLNKNLIQVTNVDGGGRLSFRCDGTAAVQDAAENFVVAAVAGASASTPAIGVKLRGGNAFVSIIPSANCKYAVSLAPAEAP